MAVHSGKYAVVHLDSCNMLEFESWDLDWGSELQPYNARSGGGHGQVEDGVHRGGGNVSGFVDITDALTSEISTGALVSIGLYHDETSLEGWTGNVKIGKIRTSANRDGTVQTISFEFQTHGALTPPSTSQA